MGEFFKNKPTNTEIGKRTRLPYKYINALGCGKSNLTKVYIYCMITGTKNNSISYDMMAQIGGCNRDTIQNGVKYLVSKRYISVRFKGDSRNSQSSVYGVNETANIDWNLISKINLNPKYGSENSKSFGLYFYLRAKDNTHKRGNDYVYINKKFINMYRLQLHILQEYQLIDIYYHKQEEVVILTFPQERVYEFISPESFDAIDIGLTEKIKKRIEAEDMRVNNGSNLEQVGRHGKREQV